MLLVLFSSDVGAAVVAFKAERYRRRPAPDGLPFGYLRMQVLGRVPPQFGALLTLLAVYPLFVLPTLFVAPQVLGALVNAVCLVSLAGYLILAAAPALFQPDAAPFQPTSLFLVVATIGVRVLKFHE